MIGGHYTYAEVPLFEFLKVEFGFERNNYDKVGHFAQGFVPALIAREILIRKSVVNGKAWLNFYIVCFCLALSAFYELIEWWVAVLTGEGADAFLGTQGYVWDTQSDMGLALLGAVVAILSLSKYHDSQLRQKTNGGKVMLDIEPVGEFGSKKWCEACAAGGVRLLQEANLPADLEWGFTEDYTHPPERLLADGREKAAYYIMVKDGKVSGGDGVPQECKALPGFHVQIQWATICNQSRSKYGREGQKKRSADEQVMFKAIAEYVDQPNPLGLGGGPKAVWPAEIGAALGKGSEEGGGLHNIAASLQMPSPEFAELPTTEMGVPDFAAMTDEQKKEFLKLCALDV